MSSQPPLPEQTHRCISAAGKFGGVYMRDVTFSADDYEFLPVPWAPKDTFDRAQRHLGKGYDYWGLLMTQFINMRRHNPDRWFCSKLCARAMGLADAHTYAPGDLKRVVEEHNRTHYAAQELIVARKALARPRTVFGGAPVFPGSGTFAGGLLAARNGAAAVLSHITSGPVDGVRASAPMRMATRSRGLAAGAARPSRISGGNVVAFPERIAR